LLLLMLAAMPGGYRFGRWYGSHVHASVRRVERALRQRAPTEVVLDRACPSLYPDREVVYATFKLLKEASVEPFGAFRDDRLAVGPEAAVPVRR
jgi:hypothetical protein